MRLIDADSLIERMKNTWDMQDLYLPVHFEDFVEDEPTAVGWISVKDHPPEKDEDVIIYGKYIGASGTAYPEMLITDIDEFVHSGYVPIAWMPLPEPPKEG